MLDWIENIMNTLGAGGILLLMLLENVFPPIPSELIMPLAGFITARQGFGFWPAVLAGTLGSLIGTGLWYAFARKVGEAKIRKFLTRHGRWFALDCDDLDRVRSWFERHGPAAVFLCRLVPGLRTLISVPAGVSRMPVVPFLLYSAAGTLIWSLSLAYCGSRLGENFQQVQHYLGPVSWIVLGLIGILYLRRLMFYRSEPSTETK